MAIRFLSTAWKDDLKSRAFPTERIYIDFRQEIYPPIGSELIKGNIVDGLLLGDVPKEDRWQYIVDGVKFGDLVVGETT